MKIRKLAVPIAWCGGSVMVVAGVAVLLWPTDPPKKTPKRAEHLIPLKFPSASPKPSSPQLAQIRELETRKDDAALAKIALAASSSEDKEQTRVRVTALYALGNVGTPPAIGVLREVLEDGTREIVLRMTAAAALAKQGSDAEIVYLRDRLANEPSKLLREKIRLVLNARRA